MTASIIDGSVTMDKLDPSIQSEFRQYMLDAQNARDAALQYQKFAKRYTIGDAEFEGSETDNAKYYYEGTKQAAAETVTNATAASQAAGTATEQAGIATKKATNATASANSASADAQTATEKASTATNKAAEATQAATDAAESANSARKKAGEASGSADDAKRYAVGGVADGDAEDNSKYYCQQAKNYAKLAQEVTDIIYPDVSVNIDTGHLVATGGNNFSVTLDDTGHLISAIGSGGG